LISVQSSSPRGDCSSCNSALPKVRQWADFSKEKKLARLELTLEHLGKLDEFRRTYREQFGDDWEVIHNDPVLGVARTAFVSSAFRKHRISGTSSARSSSYVGAGRGGRVSFLIDEAGQYVAPRSELILNSMGWRILKSWARAKSGFWRLPTDLDGDPERAALNSAELNKPRTAFPSPSILMPATFVKSRTAAS
jgi:hypothetical protein